MLTPRRSEACDAIRRSDLFEFLPMVLVSLLLLVALASFFARRGQRAAARHTGGVALAMLLLIACGPVPSMMSRAMQGPYEQIPHIAWAQRNAIVLLGTGSRRTPDEEHIDAETAAYPRLFRAVALYRACRAQQRVCMIFPSGGDPQHNGVSEGELYRRRLVSLGVSNADIVVEGRSLNTFENARFTAALLAPHAFDQVLLVTSAMHMRRSVLHFRSTGVPVVPVRADYINVSTTLLPRGNNIGITEFAMHEWLGVVAWHIGRVIGWNPTLAGMNAL
jgi:uncharacterized SAM-binding protein YcdF (DUF218 family)